MSEDKPSYWEALKIVALPLGSVIGIVGLVFWFAGEQWVRGIARDEIGKGVGTGAATSVAEHETRLTKVEGDVENHDEEIEEVEEEIDVVDQTVRDFMRDLINRL